MNPTLFRWTAFLAGVLTLTAGCLPFTFLPSFDHPGSGRSIGFLLQSIGLIACWGFFPIDRSRIRSALILIVVVSLLPRLLLLPTPPSDDIHRYRWEGKLVLAGENPFARTAADPDLISYRDGDWEKMNHKENGTVYPPLAQGVFAVLATLAPSTSGDLIHKTAFLLADIGTLFLVLYLLRRRRLPLAFALFYSLNPIVLIGIAGEAHYDSILVLALVGSIASLEAGKVRLSWIFLAASLQLKLISLVLLPLWWFQRAWRGWYWAPLILIALWIPFASGLPAWFEAVESFGGNGTFQGLLPWLFRTAGISEEFASESGGILFALLVGTILWKGGSPSTLARRILGCLLVCSPILHFWYLTWLIPFVALRPSLSWLWLCASQAGYFLVWGRFEATGYWELPPWVEPAVWIPFLLLGLVEVNRFRSYKRISRPAEEGGAPTVGIVIPTYQSADTISPCLQSIQKGSDLPDDCLIVDASSTDATVSIAHSFGARTTTATLGRGSQIHAGIRNLTTDWVLILHADCELHPEAVQAIRSLSPDVVGGGCGQRFNPGSPILNIVEFMNEGRAVIGESYWGDQGMFLRRSCTAAWEKLDRFPLMEDVELSRHLRRLGETRYLGLETKAGTAKWQSGGRARRFSLVFGTVIRFRLASMIGRQEATSRKLYQHYYGKKLDS